MEAGVTPTLLPNGLVGQATAPVIESSLARCGIFYPNEGMSRAVHVFPMPLRDRNCSVGLRIGSYLVSSRHHHHPTPVKRSDAVVAAALRGHAGVAGVSQN